MAKVYGPLHSDDARGKIASAMVFSGWKGIKTVRQWMKPVNVKSGEQGDNRLIVGGLGRAASMIGKDGDYHNQMKDLFLIPAAQSKQSAFVQYLRKYVMVDKTAFEAERTAYEAHTAKSSFASSATTLGLTDLSITYATTEYAFSAGLMLYEIARYAIANAFTGAPYTTALASWTNTEIAALVADLAAAV